MRTEDCFVIKLDDVHNTAETWCAYRLMREVEPGEPPEIIFINACRLVDVFRLHEARQNSEFTLLYAAGGSVILQVFATGGELEMRNYAIKTMMTQPEKPRCNLYGYNTYGKSRVIYCSNGKTYQNQRDAALDLGVAQPTISQHLKYNTPKSIKGHKLAYDVFPSKDPVSATLRHT